MRASFVRTLRAGWADDVTASLYRVGSSHVVVVARRMARGPEAMVLRADADGRVADWRDLSTTCGTTDARMALEDAGYEVAP